MVVKDLRIQYKEDFFMFAVVTRLIYDVDEHDVQHNDNLGFLMCESSIWRAESGISTAD